MWWLDPGKEVLNVVRTNIPVRNSLEPKHDHTAVQPHPRALCRESGHESSELWYWPR